MDSGQTTDGVKTAAPAKPGEAGTPKRSRAPAILRDVLLLVLGAALAFGVEEWRDARKRRDRVELALAGIRKEITTNVGLVESARAHHLMIADTLQKFLARRETPPKSLVYNGVFNPATVSGIAWQAAREAGVLGDMNYSIVLALAPVYEAQQGYRALADGVVMSLENDMRRDGIDVLLVTHFAQFIPLATDFSNRERLLLGRYERTLHTLDSLSKLLAR